MMRIRHYAAFLTAWLWACGPAANTNDTARSRSPDTGRAADTAWTVTPYGSGVVRIGMSLAELSQAVHETMRPAYDVNPECDFVQPKVLPKGMAIMVERDSVVRIDVDAAGILTSEGAGVGELEARVLTLFASRAQVEPHKYEGPTGHYVIVEQPGDTLYRIVFETDGQRVTRYRAGRRPAVDYVEGCA